MGEQVGDAGGCLDRRARQGRRCRGGPIGTGQRLALGAALVLPFGIDHRVDRHHGRLVQPNGHLQTPIARLIRPRDRRHLLGLQRVGQRLRESRGGLVGQQRLAAARGPRAAASAAAQGSARSRPDCPGTAAASRRTLSAAPPAAAPPAATPRRAAPPEEAAPAEPDQRSQPHARAMTEIWCPINPPPGQRAAAVAEEPRLIGQRVERQHLVAPTPAAASRAAQ